MISSSSGSTTTMSNGHCSINHGGGCGGLGPVMEIREMSGYCVPPPDKYYHAHHHPGTTPIVSGATTVRHGPVYHPQVFYTPTPPVPPTYPPSNPPPAPTDWTSCPSAASDTFSHFMYPHHQYPPPAPQHHHTDYGNFLGLPATSCYEPDIVMLSGVAQTHPSSPITLTTGNSNIVDGQVGVGSVSASIMTMTNSFLYPKPPSSSPSYRPIDHASVAARALSEKNHSNSKLPSVSTSSSSPSSPSSSDDSDLEEDDDDSDEDDKQVICIEDDDIISSLETSQESSWCMLCKKPATLTQASTVSTHPNCSSPQLAKILENIDDDELDISVCSDDIEIGGIEDEMIQAEQAQSHFKITIVRLAQLINIATSSLCSSLEQVDEEQEATLCSKCQRFVGMAESLEKQLSSVLSTLRQTMEIPEENLVCKISQHTQVSSTAVQTDPISIRENGKTSTSRIIVVQSDTTKLSSSIISPTSSSVGQTMTDKASIGKKFLCHECGSTFNCGRNLGKHLRRHHNQGTAITTKIHCSREECATTCFDNTALQNHLRVHNGDKCYFCGECFKLFSTKSNLMAHVKSKVCKVTDEKTQNAMPQRNGSNRFQCENCGLKFRTERRFIQHLNSKNGCSKSKTFQCDICNKMFSKMSELRTHQSVHSKTKCFTCDICGLGFTTKGNQRVHQRTHFKEKRFKCQLCGKGFTRNQTLQAHTTQKHKNNICDA